MNYFLIDTDWDEDGNSPWGSLWHDMPYGSLGSLDGSQSLEAIWKSPPVRLEPGTKQPDVISFSSHFAVSGRVRSLLVPIVKEEAEFLPLEVPCQETVHIIHPLWPVDFDAGAKVHCNAVSHNITVVHKYSFTLDPQRSAGPRHLFRMLQAKGSAARDHGSTMSKLIVSEVIKTICEEHGVTGIVFKHVHSTPMSKKRF